MVEWVQPGLPPPGCPGAENREGPRGHRPFADKFLRSLIRSWLDRGGARRPGDLVLPQPPYPFHSGPQFLCTEGCLTQPHWYPAMRQLALYFRKSVWWGKPGVGCGWQRRFQIERDLGDTLTRHTLIGSWSKQCIKKHLGGSWGNLDMDWM